MTRGLVLLLLLAALGVGASFCIVILDEREQGFRTLLSSPEYSVFGFQLNQAVLDEPGWYVRIPGIHRIYRYERRRLHYDSEARELQTINKLLLEVDYYVLWRIDDPRKFFESVRSIPEATRRLDAVSYGELRRRIAQNSLADLLSNRRAELAGEITLACDEALKPLGIRVEDLRMPKARRKPAGSGPWLTEIARCCWRRRREPRLRRAARGTPSQPGSMPTPTRRIRSSTPSFGA